MPLESTFLAFFTGQITELDVMISSGSPADIQFQLPALTAQSP
jgi:hypothetical protein